MVNEEYGSYLSRLLCGSCCLLLTALSVTFVVCSRLHAMDTLSELGVNINTPGCDLERQLNQLTNATLSQIRSSLFHQVQSRGIADPRDVLVKRRDTAVKTAKEKHASDVRELLSCIRNIRSVKRTLVSGGKKSCSYLDDKRLHTSNRCDPSQGQPLRSMAPVPVPVLPPQLLYMKWRKLHISNQL